MNPVSERRVSDDLYNLTRLLCESGTDISGGLLGGEYGYGGEFENDVFEMHPFWWGDCECGHEQAEADWLEAHPHADDCYQSELTRRGYWDDFDLDSRTAQDLAAERGLPELGCAVHCTCSHKVDWIEWNETHHHDPRCRMVLPNFRHKTSGVEVSWYKYIGRSMEVPEVERDDWQRIMAEVEGSIAPSCGSSSSGGEE